MPRYEFIGTKGNASGEYHLYRDEKGKVIEVPAAVANPRDKEVAAFEQKKRALKEENSNAHRVRMADRATPEMYPFPVVPAAPSGEPDFARGVSMSTPDMRHQQDVQQAYRNRQNIAFREQALRDLPSAVPTQPGPPPPEEQIQPQPTDADRFKQILARRSFGQYPAQYKTGSVGAWGIK